MRSQYFRLENLLVSVVTGEVPTAEVKVYSAHDRDCSTSQGTGTGPVDAIYRAIDAALDSGPFVVESLTYRSLGEGSDGVGEATVLVAYLGATFKGVGSDTDVLRASAEAYIDALNRIESFRSEEGHVRLMGSQLYRSYDSGIA